jgi:sulfate/thiosulfate transport system substrate-binding protein
MRDDTPVRRRSRLVTVAATGLAAALLAAGCASGASAGGQGQVNLVAYSTPQQVYQALIPEFTATPAGKGARFHESFGASGSQARAVIAGQPADVVEFSLESDMTKLVKAGLVNAGWNANAYHGMVTDSIAVLAVRKGNPKGIHGWDDLVKPGVKVVTPNPFSSGSAQWNLIAAYGAQLKEGKSPADALAFVKQMLQNTVSQPDSGSKATQAFVAGTGDVLIAYENEAIEAQQAHQPVDYVIPDQTILIENPIAATSNAADPAAANAFVQFLYTDQAQKTFADEGYRPVVAGDLDRTRFPQPPQLFTIADLGGWPKVTSQFFDPTTGSISQIENQLGVHGG